MKKEFQESLNDNYSEKILKTWKHIASQGDDAHDVETTITRGPLLSSTMSNSGMPYPGVSRPILQREVSPIEDENRESSFNRISQSDK